ncbi:MAG: hypothetical protein U0U67_12490 [Chitinophagales bacterium]
MIEWKAKIVNYKKEQRIAVYFEKRNDLIERIKKLPDARWSYTLGAWHLPFSEANLQRFKLENAVLRTDKMRKAEDFSR